MTHKPVLLHEVSRLLAPPVGGIVIDATYGAGGHAQALAQSVGPSGRVLGLDADLATVTRANENIRQGRQKNIVVEHANFEALKIVAKKHGFSSAHAILLDLGLSSTLLDDPKRGFTFQQDGPLDMRFNTSQEKTAAELLEHVSEPELADIFKQFGEERHARRIARAIVEHRKTSPLTRTRELYSLLDSLVPVKAKPTLPNTARRVFQAIRIAVNRELEVLEKVLPQAFEMLAPQGRLAVISFHSLEDRIVKRFFQVLSKGCTCPPDFPECICGKKAEGRILTRKPITATEGEIKENSRARSAKLRVIEKKTVAT